MQHAAAHAYAQTAQKTVSPRELEATVLMKAASRMQELIDDDQANSDTWEDIVRYNRKLWTVFATSVTRPENPLPDAVKQNIANLAVFVFKQSMTAEADRCVSSVRSLISINCEIAAGLRGNG